MDNKPIEIKARGTPRKLFGISSSIDLRRISLINTIAIKHPNAKKKDNINASLTVNAIFTVRIRDAGISPL